MLICCVYRKIDITNDCKKLAVLVSNIAHLKQGRDAQAAEPFFLARRQRNFNTFIS
jgi:hypothetical protein